MKIQEALERLLDRDDLSGDEMTNVMRQVMTGEATPAQIGGFLVALRMKGETVEEVAAAASVMRSLADAVSLGGVPAIDIVGTGGDSTSTFNVSTCSAIVAAAAGVPVAKHGNRSVSSKSGAADLLEAAGVRIDLSPAQVAECIARVGLGFMFAPRHHSAMKHAIGPRREMGVRTVFNLLGPLTNPAGATRQLIGVYAPEWVRPVAEVLSRLGSDHVMVVHGTTAAGGGIDEIGLEGSTQVSELTNGTIADYTISPTDFGIAKSPLERIRVSSAEQSLALIQRVLANEDCPARDIVLMNAGAAILVGDAAATLGDGIELARETLAAGAARAKLEQLIAITVRLAKATEA